MELHQFIGKKQDLLVKSRPVFLSCINLYLHFFSFSVYSSSALVPIQSQFCGKYTLHEDDCLVAISLHRCYGNESNSGECMYYYSAGL